MLEHVLEAAFADGRPDTPMAPALVFGSCYQGLGEFEGCANRGRGHRIWVVPATSHPPLFAGARGADLEAAGLVRRAVACAEGFSTPPGRVPDTGLSSAMSDPMATEILPGRNI